MAIGISNCSTATSGCQGAYAVNTGVGLWYFTGIRNMSVGMFYDHVRVNKANSDVSSKIEKGRTGRTARFNTVTLILRATW